MHNSFASAMIAVNKLKKQGLTNTEYNITVMYLGDDDDPYNNTIEGKDILDNDIMQASTGRQWRIKTLTPNKFGDLGRVADLEDRSTGLQVSGMQNGIIFVNKKSLWLNSNGLESRHQMNLPTPSADVLNTLLVHMPNKGMDLLEAGEKVIYNPTPPRNRFVVDPWVGKKRPDNAVLGIWRQQAEIRLGSGMRVKRYLTNRYGTDYQLEESDKNILSILYKTYPDMPKPSIRRTLQEWRKETKAYTRAKK